MSNRRYVKSYKDWIGSIIWKDDALFKLYHYCMYKVCRTGMKLREPQPEPMEFTVSQRGAAAELGWSVFFLRKNLMTLAELGVITLRTDWRGTAVRITETEELPDGTAFIAAENTDVLTDDTEFTAAENTGASPDDTECIAARNTEEYGVSPDDTECAAARNTEEHGVSPDATECVAVRNTEEHGVSPDATECVAARNTEEHGASPDDAACCTAWNTGVLPDDTYIEHIEYKEYKDRQRETYRERGCVCLSGFTEFWQAYPAERRLGKAEASGCYDQAIRSGATPEMLMMILAEDKASAIWRKENGRYIPGMAKWFAREKWRERMPAPREREEEPWKPR